MTKNKDFGEAVDYTPAPNPLGISLEGRMVTLAPLAASHAGALHESFSESTDGAIWDYLSYGPFKNAEAYGCWITEMTAAGDPYFFAILDKTTDRFVGVASYLRIDPEAGSIEVGHINFSPLLQNTIAATEAMYVMMQWVFENGYRRYEWKCNALNLRSRAAAQRLGFSFEGVFRQAGISKGRNRDTAWFGIIDKEWPQLKAAYGTWLRPENFDEECRQKERLSALTAPIRAASDPALS
jgi:RimJ/RimL family protein N-acetyltransferase